MKILVTGGAGFLGTHLCELLRTQDHKVLAVDLVNGRNHVRADVGEYRQIALAVEQFQPDLVYHMAAEFGRNNGEDYYEQLWRTNAVGTKNVLRLQETHGFRLVYFSSSEVYGDYPDLMTESVLAEKPIRQLNDYAITKWVGEQQVMNAADRHGCETVRVRLFNTYGPGEHWNPYRSVITQFVHAALHDLPYTVYLGYHRTSTYVDDMVRTLANIATCFKPGAVYNIAGSEYHDIKTASDLVLRWLGKDDRRVKYLECDAHNTVSKRPDVTAAIADLGHECRVPLEDGICRTIAWRKAQS